MTRLYYTYEQFRNEGTERRTFAEILSKLHQQMVESIPSNLDIVPSLIEQTNKLVRIDQSIGASINDLLIDYDDRIISYYIYYKFCTDVAEVFAYNNLILGVRIIPNYVQVSHLDYIPLADDFKINNANLEILNDFINEKLLRKYNDKGEEAELTESGPTAPFIQVSCTLRLIGSNPYKVWDETKSQSHEFFMIKIDAKADRVTQLLSIEEMASINKDIRGLVTSELGLGI